MASQITADGRVIAPLNITNPAPALDLAGFQWAAVTEVNRGPQLPQRAVAAQKPLSSQQPESAEEQVHDQLTHPGGPSEKPPPPLAFPLTHFQGAYAGNGFNLIWIPTQFPGLTVNTEGDDGPDDAKLLLSLTTEQLTFGPTLGNIPNRGIDKQDDIELTGLAYMQSVQNVTNTVTGKGDKPRTAVGSGIHFEPGVWLYVPKADFQTGDSIVRMASIPHGTTINAQGVVPPKNPDNALGGVTGAPTFGPVDSTPFNIKETVDDKGQKKGVINRLVDAFKAPMDPHRVNETRRVPENLALFVDAETITKEIIKDPNVILQNAIRGLHITDHIAFEITTGTPEETPIPEGTPKAQLNGGGTANIAFLAGPQKITTLAPGARGPNAHAESMTAKFWIERVEYDVIVPNLKEYDSVELRPEMPPSPHQAPTPRFWITAPKGGVPRAGKKIKVPGIQIQYSQTVNLVFGGLVWPHISVATLVPTDPQPYRMTGKEY